MRTLCRLSGGVALAAPFSVAILPLSMTAMVTARLDQAAAMAAEWDVPPQLVPVFQEAGRAAGVPWALLAGVASVATDFGRHGPDGAARGDAVGTSIFPVLVPSLPGGMFLIDPAVPALAPTQEQDVRASTGWLAETLAMAAAAAARQTSPAGGSRWWTQLVASLPLHIDAVAASGVDRPPGTPAGVPAPGAAAPAPAAAPGDNPVRAFGTLVLPRLGAPVTAANLDAFDAWAAGEGSCAAFNPLDTTQPAPGATAFNTLPGGGHVWNYPSLDTGVRATVETLLNGLYQPILTVLQAGAGIAALAGAVRRSPWGTVVFGSPSYDARQCATGPGRSLAGTARPQPHPSQGSQASQTSQALPLPPTVAGPDAIAATIVVRAATYQTIWDQSSAGGPP